MKKSFKIQQKELLSMLASMQPICSKRTTLDVTESILFHITPKELILKATDLEISLQSSAEIESSLTENENFLISGRRVFDLVKEIEGEITGTLKNNQLHVSAKGVDIALNIRSAEDFPPFPERIENLMQMDASFLLKILNKVSFIVPSNHSNSALNGMLLECNKKGMTLVATDGHCLAEVLTKKYTCDEEKKWLLPKRAVQELKKVLETANVPNVFLGLCGNQLVFSGEHFNFFTKLIAESFPQYKPVMNKEGFRPAVLPRSSLTKTLKRASCLLAGQFLSTNFTFKPGIVDISLNNKEVGKLDESLELQKFEGETIKSRFYAPYLLSGLQAFSEEMVQFHIKDNAKPIIFEDVQKEFTITYLVMPVSATQQES